MEEKYNAIYEYKINEDYRKVSSFLQDKHNYSSRVLKYIIRNGLLTVNSSPARFVDNLKKGDTVKVYFPKEEFDSEITKLPLDIIYEDNDVLIVNKSMNMVVHPTNTHKNDTLANAVYYHWNQINFKGKARFVNRIDMDTTGLVVIGKNKYVHHFLQNEGSLGRTNKTYLLITEGIPKEEKGIINKPLSRSEGSIIERKVDEEDGKECITEYEVLEKHGDKALVRARLLTGRTHQIRVHFAYIGCPLLGDTLYNKNKTELISRQALHSYEYSFTHPFTKEYLTFKAPIPNDFKKALSLL